MQPECGLGGRLALFLGSFSLVVFGSGSSCHGHKQPPRPKYNVLFIAIDDLNNAPGYLGGPAITPNLDALASVSYRFTNAATVSPACNPSRAALLTGQRPETTGQFDNETDFREKPGGASRVTLPQYLMQFGARAYAAGKIFHREAGYAEVPEPMSDPPSWFAQRRGDIGTSTFSNLYLDANGHALWLQGMDPQSDYLRRRGFWGPVPEATQQTEDWKSGIYIKNILQAGPTLHPLFLALGIFRPHMPLVAPQEFFALYPLEAIPLPEVPLGDLDDVPPLLRTNFTTPFVELMREMGEWEKAVQGYLASVSFADAVVGNVLAALESSIHADDTIVVLWGDHGFHLGDKDRWEKFTNWNQSTQTPLLIRLPGQTQGVSVEQPVSLLDIYPTLVELLGLPPNEQVQGVSLVPLMNEPSRVWPHPAIVTNGTLGPSHYSVHLGHWNYIRQADGAEELYDLEADPHEFTNLAEDPEAQAVQQHLETELYCMSVRVANPELDLAELEPWGSRYAESFDELSGPLDSDPRWTTRVLGNGGDLMLGDGVLTAPAGGAVATYDELSLDPASDFLLSVATRFDGAGVSGGLVFGYQDEDDFLEFHVSDGNGLGANGQPREVDASLIWHIEGQPPLVVDWRRLPNVDPSAWYRVVVQSDAAQGTLELTILDPLREVFFREQLTLEVPDGLFGISSYGRQVFDAFNVLVHPPQGADFNGDDVPDPLACGRTPQE